MDACFFPHSLPFLCFFLPFPCAFQPSLLWNDPSTIRISVWSSAVTSSNGLRGRLKLIHASSVKCLCWMMTTTALNSLYTMGADWICRRNRTWNRSTSVYTGAKSNVLRLCNISVTEKHNMELWKLLLSQFIGCAASIEPISMGAPPASEKSASYGFWGGYMHNSNLEKNNVKTTRPRFLSTLYPQKDVWPVPEQTHSRLIG